MHVAGCRLAGVDSCAGVPRSQFIWSRSWIRRSTAVPPDCERSAIQSFQSAGGDSRNVETARGRPNCPAATRRCNSTYSGQKRSTMPTMNTASLRDAAATIASASSFVSAIGFSRKTLLPAASARSAYSTVEQRRQADVDGVDVRIRIAASRSPVTSAPTSLGHPCGPLGCLGRDRLDTHPVTERLVVGGVSRTHETAAEDRDGDHQ